MLTMPPANCRLPRCHVLSERSGEWFKGGPRPSRFCCLKKIIFHFLGWDRPPLLLCPGCGFEHSETGYSHMEGKVLLEGSTVLGLGLFFTYIFWRGCPLNHLHKEMCLCHVLCFPRNQKRIAAQAELSAVLYQGSIVLCACENNWTATKKWAFYSRINNLVTFTKSEKWLNMKHWLCSNSEHWFSQSNGVFVKLYIWELLHLHHYFYLKVSLSLLLQLLF